VVEDAGIETAALNDMIESKLQNKLEAFSSVNGYLRDTVAKLEKRNSTLEDLISECKSQATLNQHLVSRLTKAEEENKKLKEENKHMLEQSASIRSTSIVNDYLTARVAALENRLDNNSRRNNASA